MRSRNEEMGDGAEEPQEVRGKYDGQGVWVGEGDVDGRCTYP